MNMIPPLPFLLQSRLWNYKTSNKTNIIDMPGQQPHTSTVTISLKEYNEMRQSLDTLHNALEDNKVIIHEPYSRVSYTTCQTFTRDEALTKVAEKYYEMEERFKSTQANNEYLACRIHELTSTRWYMLGKWLSKRILMRK